VLDRVTPLGRLPLTEKIGTGLPVALKEKVPAEPTVNVVVVPDVIAGSVATMRVKLWVAEGEAPFEAVIVIGYVPAVPDGAVPASTPRLENVTPVGRAPTSENVEGGVPLAFTVNEPAEPTVNVVAAAEVKAGACSTLNVKNWMASGETPFSATMVRA
jgi:hypothetical protein